MTLKIEDSDDVGEFLYSLSFDEKRVAAVDELLNDHPDRIEYFYDCLQDYAEYLKETLNEDGGKISYFMFDRGEPHYITCLFIGKHRSGKVIEVDKVAKKFNPSVGLPAIVCTFYELPATTQDSLN